MKQLTFHLLFLALILSACHTTKNHNTFNNKTYEWDKIPKTSPPTMDSTALSVLLNAINIWDEPQLYKTINFTKVGKIMYRQNDGAEVKVNYDGKTAEVSMVCKTGQCDWLWMLDKNTETWELVGEKVCSGQLVRDEWLNPILNDLYTASLRADLAFLENFLGPSDSIWINSPKADTFDLKNIPDMNTPLKFPTSGELFYGGGTILTDSSDFKWHVRYSYGSYNWTWEYESLPLETGGAFLIYHFNEQEKCIDATFFAKEEGDKIRSFIDVSCIPKPPIPTSETGLKPK